MMRDTASERSLANDLHQHPLPPPAVKFAVKDLLPWAEIEPAIGDGDDYLATHDLPLEVGVGIVLARAVVEVLAGGGMGGQRFQPLFVI